MDGNSDLSADHVRHHQEGKMIDLYHIGKWGAIAIIAYYLLTEHRAHVIQYLLYVVILACPLPHLGTFLTNRRTIESTLQLRKSKNKVVST